jgi:precorrin-6B methylase 2
VVPKPLRTKILKRKIRRRILDQYGSLPENELNEDQKEIVNYLRENEVSIFPYPFQENYRPEQIVVFYDPSTGMKYVLHDGKRLYFKKKWNEKRIRKSYSELSKEQDPKSPHRYTTSDFQPGPDDVVADIGAAEGNFSLSIINKVKKIYIFEYDKEWVEALKATFAGWAEKVEIIPLYVADFDNERHIRLDTFFRKHNDITFIKIDVDGYEQKVLEGCRSLLESEIPLRIAICTYHKNDDENEFTNLLQDHGFRISASGGYMINYYDKKLKTPWLRRGLLRAVRN